MACPPSEDHRIYLTTTYFGIQEEIYASSPNEWNKVIIEEFRANGDKVALDLPKVTLLDGAIITVVTNGYAGDGNPNVGRHCVGGARSRLTLRARELTIT